MTARLLDGQAIAAAIRQSVLPDVGTFTAAAGRPPGLGIVLVGDAPASEIYVRNKARAGTESGLWVDLQRLPFSATLEDLLAVVDRLTRSDCTTAFSCIPSARGTWSGPAQRFFDAIVLGRFRWLSPLNVGRLVQAWRGSRPARRPRDRDAPPQQRPMAGRAVIVAAARSSEAMASPAAARRDGPSPLKTRDLPACAHGRHSRPPRWAARDLSREIS